MPPHCIACLRLMENFMNGEYDTVLYSVVSNHPMASMATRLADSRMVAIISGFSKQ